MQKAQAEIDRLLESIQKALAKWAPVKLGHGGDDDLADRDENRAFSADPSALMKSKARGGLLRSKLHEITSDPSFNCGRRYLDLEDAVSPDVDLKKYIYAVANFTPEEYNALLFAIFYYVHSSLDEIFKTGKVDDSDLYKSVEHIIRSLVRRYQIPEESSRGIELIFKYAIDSFDEHRAAKSLKDYSEYVGRTAQVRNCGKKLRRRLDEVVAYFACGSEDSKCHKLVRYMKEPSSALPNYTPPTRQRADGGGKRKAGRR